MDSKSPEIKTMFKRHGFDIRTDMTHRFATENDPGRSDSAVMIGEEFVYVEFKDDEAGLDLGEGAGWRKNQRAWAKRKVQNGSRYWICLVAGANRPDAGDNLEPKKAWLIPQRTAEYRAKFFEENIGRKMIPYKVKPGTKKWRAMEARGLDCVRMFSEFELVWENGGWVIPSKHLFWLDFSRESLECLENSRLNSNSGGSISGLESS